MTIIGILGDIGSGKTFISNLFGFPVFNADAEVGKIYKKNYKCFLKLKKKFPSFVKSFPINKKELSNLIKHDKSNIVKIGKIVHPFVKKNLEYFFKKNKSKKIVILDIPLLLENKLTSSDMILIFIDAPKKDLIKRLRKRKNFNPKLYNIIKKNQLPLSLKKKKSNFIIRNNFKIEYVKKKIKEIKLKLKNRE